MYSFPRLFCIFILHFLSHVGNVNPKIPTILCKIDETNFKKGKFMVYAPLPPGNNVECYALVRNNFVKWRVTSTTQHCYGGEGGIGLKASKMNKRLIFSTFLCLSHLFLHRIVGILSPRCSKGSKHNIIFSPLIKAVMGTRPMLLS